MKRVIFILSLVMAVAFAGTAMAQCPFYGEGYVYGYVTMYGAFGGQEGATVFLNSGGPQDAAFGTAITDATGYYTLHNPQLWACAPYNTAVRAYYLQMNGGGQLSEYWAAQAPVYFQQPNQGEILGYMANLPLWFISYF